MGARTSSNRSQKSWFNKGENMMYFTVLGFVLGLTAGYLLWYGFKERADLLSKRCETLQYCLDICSDCVEELQSLELTVRGDRNG